mgnify:CR=1 FL=1
MECSHTGLLAGADCWCRRGPPLYAARPTSGCRLRKLVHTQCASSAPISLPVKGRNWPLGLRSATASRSASVCIGGSVYMARARSFKSLESCSDQEAPGTTYECTGFGERKAGPYRTALPGSFASTSRAPRSEAAAKAAAQVPAPSSGLGKTTVGKSGSGRRWLGTMYGSGSEKVCGCGVGQRGLRDWALHEGMKGDGADCEDCASHPHLCSSPSARARTLKACSSGSAPTPCSGVYTGVPSAPSAAARLKPPAPPLSLAPPRLEAASAVSAASAAGR